nr:MAG TPA: hypothetical protein [Caudoviricetes sp.]
MRSVCRSLSRVSRCSCLQIWRRPWAFRMCRS